MKILQRACLYIIRRKKKSLMLSLIILAVSTLVMSGLAILDAQEKASEELRGATGTSFSIKRNISSGGWTSGANGSYSTQEFITDNMLDQIAEVNGIEGYNASITSILSLYAEDKSYIEHMNPIGVREVDDQFYSVGCMDSQYNSLFLSQAFTLVEGKHLINSDSNGILISKDVADKEGIKVGDTITAVNNPSADPTVELEVTGIFEIVADETDEKNNYNMASYYDYANYIFVSIPSMKEALINYPDSTDFDSADFFVKDPENLEKIIQQVQNINSINWDNYVVETNNEVYEKAEGSMSNVGTLIKALIGTVVVISAIVIVAILTIWFKGRKKEIGILLSLGLSKLVILLQYVIEILIVSAFAFPISYICSNLIAGKIGGLLGKNVESVIVTVQHFSIVTGLGVLILVASVIVSCIPTMKFNPKDILSQTD